MEKGVWTTKPYRVGKDERFGEKILGNNRDGYIETSAGWRTMIFVPQALWFKSLQGQSVRGKGSELLRYSGG